MRDTDRSIELYPKGCQCLMLPELSKLNRFGTVVSSDFVGGYPWLTDNSVECSVDDLQILIFLSENIKEKFKKN